MVIPPLIEHKRDGHALAPEQWAGLIEEYTADRVPDYQMAALLMAVVWRGLAPDELAALTDAMIASGDRLRFDDFPLPRVDKHSTGGVGDKVSLLLAPMVASCGVAVPMIFVYCVNCIYGSCYLLFEYRGRGATTRIV